MLNRFSVLAGWLALALLAMPAFAQEPPNHYFLSPQTTNSPRSVHAADLDGDGQPDLLSASYNDSKIAWYKNFGGQIGSQQIISTSVNAARSVRAADLDGDGDHDVVAMASSELVWFENTDGLGTFSDKRILSTAISNGREVYTADLNGDGLMDVLATSAFGDNVDWYLNEGDGSFSDYRRIASINGADGVHAADLDGDGDPDVLSAASGSDQLAWYENTNGAGTFSSANVLSSTLDVVHAHAADLDGDGDNDVLFAAYSNDTIGWFENADGEGTFAGPKEITTGADGAIAVYAADLDGDGDPEVLTASYGTGVIAIHDNQIGESGADPDGFGPTVELTNTAPRARDVYATDLDGDGDADILAASERDDTISMFENRVRDGQGFGAETVIMPSARADAPYSAIAADVNGDGALDVLTASYNDDTVAWHANDGTPGLSPQRVITDAAAGAVDVAAGDLDGDGDLDVAFAAYDSGTFAWVEHLDGSGTFADEATVLTNTAPRAWSVEVVDLDGDGDLDILTASESDDTIAWFENTDGNGAFSAEQTIWTAADGAQHAIAADLDGDGDLDVVAASSGDDTIAWFENVDGEGTFSTEKPIVETASGANYVQAGDLDGDGDLDLAYSAFGADAVYWLRNTDGEGAFAAPAEVTNQVDGPTAVALADFNGDGNLDVASASENDDTIAWYAQTQSFGVLDFADQVVLTSRANRAHSVVAADMDGNGRVDVLYAALSDEVAWFENELGTTLPVELAGFTAVRAGSRVMLEWATASETNNAGFDVERAVDGAPFASLGFVDGHGTTADPQRYRFVDPAPPFATALRYRLRQVDTDGTFAYSPVVAVRPAVEQVALVPSTPNPFRTTAHIRYMLPEPTAATLQVYDLLGRRVATLADGMHPAGHHEATLNGTRLAPGTYFVRLRAGSAVQTHMIRLVR